MICVRFDSKSIQGCDIKATDWSSTAKSSAKGLCFFPIEEIRNYCDDIRELSIKLSRDLGHSCDVCLIAEITPDKRSIGHYNFADDIIREVSITSWDHAKIIAEVPAYKGLNWNQIQAL